MHRLKCQAAALGKPSVSSSTPTPSCQAEVRQPSMASKAVSGSADLRAEETGSAQGKAASAAPSQIRFNG